MTNDSLLDKYQQLSRGRKMIVIVFMIWLIQAVPKWTAAITADGELSAQIMTTFITPRADQLGAYSDDSNVYR